MKSKIFVFLFAFSSVYILFNRMNVWENYVFRTDKFGYYSYLPAIFIYKDLGGLSFYPKVTSKYKLADNEWYGVYGQPTGKKLNKYHIGVALFELPFFAGAHIYATQQKRHPADGYSMPYQLAITFSNIFWVIAGLVILRKLLLRYFKDAIVTVTLICIALGTNLYNYTVFDHGMSHPVSFFLFSAALYLAHLWHGTGKNKYLYWLAITMGCIVIVRPVNVLFAVIPLLWPAGDAGSTPRSTFFLTRYRALLIAGILSTAVVSLQLAYWKYITGYWIHFSYQDEGFNFLRPNIQNGLFSYRKGWFVYTPLAFVGLLGFIPLWKQGKRLALALLVFFIVFIYTVFSWREWWYGGSFGSRPMIETLAILSFPFAALCKSVFSLRQASVKIAFTFTLILFIALNMFQSYQYQYNVLHWDRMTKAYYWRTFLKMQVKDEDRELLL